MIKGLKMTEQPKITFESNPIYSFYGLWRACMYAPDASKKALEGFHDERLSKIADIIPAKGTRARLMAEKMQELIGKSNIQDFDGFKTLMNANFDSHEVENFGKILEQGFEAYKSFWDKNKENLEKNINAMNIAQSSYSKDLANLYKCFKTSADKQSVCYLNPFPKDKINDGISNSENVSMDYSLSKTENNDNYFENSDILKRKLSTPFHETTHLLFLNSQLKKDIESEKSPEISGVLNRVISKFEKKGIGNNKASREQLKYFAVGTINEAFAACSSALYRDNTTGKPAANNDEWYYGYKEANDLARQMYPVFKDYVSSGKPFDDQFFKKLEASIKIDELRNSRCTQTNEKDDISKIDKLRGLSIKNEAQEVINGAKTPYKPNHNISKVDLSTLKMYQNKKQNS